MFANIALLMTDYTVLYIYMLIYPLGFGTVFTVSSPNLTSLPTDLKVCCKIEQLNIHAMFHIVTEEYVQS